jgi:DNA-binding NarL/FixJ family response regulator
VSGLIALFDRHWSAAAPPARSTREEDVIALLAEGLTDAVVARRLGVSERTVTATVRTLMDRYGARSRFQLALALVVELSPPPPAPPLR